MRSSHVIRLGEILTVRLGGGRKGPLAEVFALFEEGVEVVVWARAWTREHHRHCAFFVITNREQLSPTRNNHDIGGTAAGLRRLAARSRGCDKVAFPLNSAAAKTKNIPTLCLQPLILLFVFGRTTK
jgi:hypothetical protein